MVGRVQSKNWTALLVALGAVLLFAIPADAQKGKGRGKGRKRIADKAPVVGDEAPNFKLKTREGDGEVELSSFRGKKPVVLIFGSYT